MRDLFLLAISFLRLNGFWRIKLQVSYSLLNFFLFRLHSQGFVTGRHNQPDLLPRRWKWPRDALGIVQEDRRRDAVVL